MSDLRTVARNTAYLSTAQILNPLTSVVLIGAIARLQGAEVLGEYSVVMAVFWTVAALAGLGLGIPVTRAVAVQKERASDFLVVSSFVGMAFGIIAVVGVRYGVTLFNYSEHVQSATKLLMWALFPSVVIFFCDAIFLAFEKAHYVAVMSVIENVMKVAIGFVLLTTGKSLFSLFVLILCLRFLVCIVYLALFRCSIGPIRFRFDVATLKELRQQGPVFTANLVVDTLFARVDILLLSTLGTMTQVGYYSAALKLVMLARVFPGNLVRTALPGMSQAAETGLNAVQQLFKRLTGYTAVYGVGSAVGIYLLSELLIRTTYGPNLAGAVLPLRILSFLLVPASFTPIYAAALFAAKRQLLDLIANLGGCLSFCLLCFLLVPSLDIKGAAIALIVSFLFRFLTMQLFVSRTLFSTGITSSLRYPILAGLCALATGLVAAQWSPIFGAIIAGTIYCSLILLFESEMRVESFRFCRKFLEKFCLLSVPFLSARKEHKLPEEARLSAGHTFQAKVPQNQNSRLER